MPHQTLPYGSWPSSITTDLLTADTVHLGELRVDGEDVYWLEGRASDSGRSVLVRGTPDGTCQDLTAAPFNVRTRVHEYGGGAFAVRDGVVVASNFDDCRLYRFSADQPAGEPRAITPEAGYRYAEPVLDLPRRRLLAIREDHTDPDSEPVDTLVSLELDGPNDDGGEVIASGADFVSSPTLSATGDHLAWVSWNHPAMPWDRATIWVADVDAGGSLGTPVAVTDGTFWAQQPRWAADGRLFFIAETSGWANLTFVEPNGDGFSAGSLPPFALEFGGPGWLLGAHDYDFLPDGRVLASFVEQGIGRLGILDPADGSLTRLDTDFVATGPIAVAGEAALLIGETMRSSSAVARLTLSADVATTTEVLQQSTDGDLDPATLSLAEPVVWDNSKGQQVHGFYYPPTNGQVEADRDERPPLLVMSHGGPTAMSPPGLYLETQYWTSRGFAILDVNYGGSTGFGKEYRNRLAGQWGVVDVDDCATGAQAMAGLGRADAARLAIRGWSAGGFTTLCALTFTDVFSAGASHFGVADLEALTRDIPKFESRYSDGLVGPYPAARDLYLERSPIHHIEQLSSPMILFQGADDEIVRPSQAREMARALRDKGLPVALVVFDGEGHGFRREATIRRVLEAELYFYSRVFGFELAEPVQPVEIDNLPSA